MTNRHIARRTLLSGLAVGAGLGASLSSSPAGARAGTEREISSEGHLAQKGDVKLAMYRKWAGKVGGWPAKPLPVLFLVHGSSLSSRSSFDLAFPDSTYSVMDVFAGYGFDVWTMDHEAAAGAVFGSRLVVVISLELRSGVFLTIPIPSWTFSPATVSMFGPWIMKASVVRIELRARRTSPVGSRISKQR